MKFSGKMCLKIILIATKNQGFTLSLEDTFSEKPQGGMGWVGGGVNCDVLLLADVFEEFRNNSLNNYELCLSHYLTAPSLSWHTMLKMTKVVLELIPDPDMYILFEKGTRRGISYVSNRYSKANNKYLKSNDPKQESKQIIYLSVNNLYSYAMSKFLPTNGFK